MAIRKAIGWIRRRDPARLLVWFSLVGIAGALIFHALPEDAPWIPIAAPVYILALVPKCALWFLLPATVAFAAVRHGEQRKLVRLALVWGLALFVLISALALERQRLVLMTVHEREIRYVPASGNAPDVGLRYVTWPPTGAGVEWVSDDFESPLVKLYPKMWHSGQIYWHEILLAMLMVGL